MILFEVEFWEWLLVPIYMLFLLFIGGRIKTQNINKPNSGHYKYFQLGLFVKLIGVLFFCCIYVYYYRGGDTIMYFNSAEAMYKLLLDDPGSYFEMLFQEPSREAMSLFTSDTGRPYSYIYYDDKTCMVAKITSLLMSFGLGSYLLTSMVISFIAYLGTWKLYSLFVEYYYELRYQFLFAVIFVPSIIFWGSGVLKDTYTFFAVGIYAYQFNKIFVQRNYRKLLSWAGLILSLWVMISIKPYIFMIMLPCSFLWVLFRQLNKTKNLLVTLMISPFIFGVLSVSTYLLLTQLGDSLSKFSIDNALQTAQVIQADMLNVEAYGANNFNVGNFDGSFVSAILLFPNAVFAGLFRPFILEASNVVMLLSGMENLALLGISIAVIVKAGIRKIWYIYRKNPLVTFSLTYAVIFAFTIGLTTANFGALVRFKIPIYPMYIGSLLIIIYQSNIDLFGIRKSED